MSLLADLWGKLELEIVFDADVQALAYKADWLRKLLKYLVRANRGFPSRIICAILDPSRPSEAALEAEI